MAYDDRVAWFKKWLDTDDVVVLTSNYYVAVLLALM